MTDQAPETQEAAESQSSFPWWIVSIVLILGGTFFIHAFTKPLTCTVCGHSVEKERAKVLPFQSPWSWDPKKKTFCEQHAPKCDFIGYSIEGDKYFNNPKPAEVKQDGSPFEEPPRKMIYELTIYERTNIVHLPAIVVTQYLQPLVITNVIITNTAAPAAPKYWWDNATNVILMTNSNWDVIITNTGRSIR